MQLHMNLLMALATTCILATSCSASPLYYEKPPRADPMPNDVYKDIVKHEPELNRDSRLLYKNLGPLSYYIQDPEQADYLVVDRNARLPNEVSNKEVAAAGPVGLPFSESGHLGPRGGRNHGGRLPVPSVIPASSESREQFLHRPVRPSHRG